jgi:hypothetical protein
MPPPASPITAASRASADEICPPRQGSRNPWVLVGAGATALVLASGFVAFKAGNARASQFAMRARVLTQGATVALMVATSGAGVFTLDGAAHVPARAREAFGFGEK